VAKLRAMEGTSEELLLLINPTTKEPRSDWKQGAIVGQSYAQVVSGSRSAHRLAMLEPTFAEARDYIDEELGDGHEPLS
jgi:hypothetical protein